MFIPDSFLDRHPKHSQSTEPILMDFARVSRQPLLKHYCGNCHGEASSTALLYLHMSKVNCSESGSKSLTQHQPPIPVEPDFLLAWCGHSDPYPGCPGVCRAPTADCYQSTIGHIVAVHLIVSVLLGVLLDWGNYAVNSNRTHWFFSGCSGWALLKQWFSTYGSRPFWRLQEFYIRYPTC